MEELRIWLRGQGLEQHASKFEELGWDSVDILQDMEPDDIKVCIDKPGHRKKFEKGLKTNPPASDTGIPAEKVKSYRSEDTKLDEENVKTEQHVEAQLGQLITEITYDTADTDRSGQQGACKIREPDTHIIDQSEKEDKSVDNTSVGSALVPYRVSETTTFLDSKQGSSIADSGNTAKYAAAKTVVVRGAQSQIIEILPDEKARTCIYRDESMISEGCKASGDQVRCSTEDGINHIIDTEPPDSSINEDMASVVSMEGRVEDHHLVTGAAANMPITSATIVTDSQNVTIAKIAEVYHVHQNVEEKPTDNFKDQTSVVVQSYRNKDHLYIETTAFYELKEIVDDRYWATITGRSGDGKTAMAAHLLLQYKDKGYEPVIVLNPQDWKVLVEGIRGKRQYVMIDDMFGGLSVDEIKVNEWLTMIDFMQRVVKERAGQLIVVSTNRKYVFMDIKSKLENYACFHDSAILDLTAQKHKLDHSEKTRIWNKYAIEYNISYNAFSDSFFDSDSPHGFPRCVEMYCSNAFLRKKGEAFFKNPMQLISQEISNFMENDKPKYYLLLYIFFLNKNGFVDITDFVSNSPESTDQVTKAAGLAAPPAYLEVQKAVKSLLNTYIAEKSNGLYSFSHASIAENVAYVYMKNAPLSAIENLALYYITSYTRCYGYKSESLKPIYVFPLPYTRQLIKRMVKEILEGNVNFVALYDAWDDKSFIAKWIDYLLFTLQYGITKTIFTNILFTDNQDEVSLYQGPNIIEALIYNNREKALISMFAEKEIFKEFNDFALGEIVSKWLMLACAKDLDKRFIQQLIHAGANVQTVWTETKFSKFGVSLYRTRGYQRIGVRKAYIKHFSPLLLAVIHSNTEVVSFLLEHNASIFLNGKADILIVALMIGEAKIVKLIFQFSSKWVNSSPLLKYSDFPLDRLQMSEVVVSLCSNRILIKQSKIEYLCTPVHIVEDIESLKELLKQGAELNTDVLISGKRMSHFLFRLFNNTDVLLLREMIRYGMMIKGEWMGLSCLHCFVLACFCYRTSESLTMRIIFPKEQDKMDEVCQFVTKVISSSSCACLINERDKQGNTALHYVMEQWSKSTRCDTRIKDAIFKSFLSNNADVNLPNREGATVVMKALESCLNVKHLLGLINRRKPQLVDNTGKGYLHYLACTQLSKNGVQELFLSLLGSGEDINLQDYHGNPPVFYSASRNMHAFVNAGADLSITNKSGENILCTS